MFNFSHDENNYFLPITCYWGFFKSALEFPFLKDIQYSFRLSKKEYMYVLTFMTFFFKCFLLDQKIFYDIHSNNLYLTLITRKNNYVFLFFLLMLRVMNRFMPYNLVVKKHIFLLGKNSIGTTFWMTKKFFFLISEVFTMVWRFFRRKKKKRALLLMQLYSTLQLVFYSSKGYPLTVMNFSKLFLPQRFANYFPKLSELFY